MSQKSAAGGVASGLFGARNTGSFVTGMLTRRSSVPLMTRVRYGTVPSIARRPRPGAAGRKAGRRIQSAPLNRYEKGTPAKLGVALSVLQNLPAE